MESKKKGEQSALCWAKKIKAIRALGGKCSKCGDENYCSMEFHHKGEKDFMIGHSSSRWSKIKKELEKCILLCANCHAEIHSSGGRNYLEKCLIFKSGLKEQKCSKCGYDKSIAALEFHHSKGKKKYGLNQIIMRKVKATEEDFLEELGKCDVLCRNCHRKLHNESRLSKMMPRVEKKISKHKELQPAIDRNRVKEMLEAGMRPIQISKELNCTKSTISYAMKQLREARLIVA